MPPGAAHACLVTHATTPVDATSLVIPVWGGQPLGDNHGLLPQIRVAVGLRAAYVGGGKCADECNRSECFIQRQPPMPAGRLGQCVKKKKAERREEAIAKQSSAHPDSKHGKLARNGVGQMHVPNSRARDARKLCRTLSETWQWPYCREKKKIFRQPWLGCMS